METEDLATTISRGPENGVAYRIRADDGVSLRIASWKYEGDVNYGTVFLFPGRTDYIEQYGQCVTDLNERGFSAMAIDWRGQGLSDRAADHPMKGHVGHFHEYQKDVAAFVATAEQLKMPKPWFLLGHSMGGSIGLRALIEGLPVSACAFTAPMWEIHLPPIMSKIALPLTWVLKSAGMKTSFFPGQSSETYVLRESFGGNTLTSDSEMYEYWVNLAKSLPDRQTAGPTTGWLYQALAENRRLVALPSPDVPCLCYYGQEEAIVGTEAIDARMASWKNGRLEVISSARHEILMETPVIRKRALDEVCKLFTDFSE